MRSASSARRFANHHRLVVALEGEVGGEVPARQMDVRARPTQFLRDHGEGLGAVDENVDDVPGPPGGSPAAQPPAGGSSARDHPIRRKRR